MKLVDYEKINAKGFLIAAVLIVALGIGIQYKYINEFPSFIHAWAQDDRYALSIGFLDNGFDLFHPETMIYNKQFPGEWEVAYDTTITAVDFPIHEYIVALLMKLFGTTSPWVFRLWTMICSIIGLFFLYKLSYLITEDFQKSLFVTTIAMTAPVYAYYFNGFLPGIPAFAIGIIGMWAYIKFVKSGKKKYFHLGILLMALATLIRTTFAIELIAVLGFELLRIFRKESTFADKLPSVIISVALIIAYMLWNSHLRSEHGSLFLNKLLPPDNIENAKELLSLAKEHWEYQYFQKLHYRIFEVLAALSLVAVIVKLIIKRKGKTEGKSNKKQLTIWLIPIIYIFGCLLFSIVMMDQLPNHDYYFVETFFLPILLLYALMLGSLPKIKNYIAGGISFAVLCVLCFFMVKNVNETQVDRRWIEDGAYKTYLNFVGSDEFLDSLNVPGNTKILALYAYPQNGPFIQMKRKGYTVMWHNEKVVKQALTWDFDYVVIENQVFREQFEEHKDVLDRLNRIADNGRISVCTLSDTTICKSPEDFFGNNLY